METKKVRVAKVKNGLGICAQRACIQGEILFELKGSFITYAEDVGADQKTRANTYRYSKSLFLNPAGELGDFLNHSCQPNARIEKRGRKLLVVAFRKISPKKEVTIDYSTIIAADDTWTMRCTCGSARCRRLVGAFRALPLALQNKYLRTKIVPAYILAIDQRLQSE